MTQKNLFEVLTDSLTSQQQEGLVSPLSPELALGRMKAALVEVKEAGARRLGTSEQRSAFHHLIDGAAYYARELLSGVTAQVVVEPLEANASVDKLVEIRIRAMALIRLLQGFLGFIGLVVALLDRSVWTIFAAMLILFLAVLEVVWNLCDPAKRYRKSFFGLVVGPIRRPIPEMILRLVGLKSWRDEILAQIDGRTTDVKMPPSKTELTLDLRHLTKAASHLLEPLDDFVSQAGKPEGAPTPPSSIYSLLQALEGRRRDGDTERLKIALDTQLHDVLQELHLKVVAEWSPDDDPRLWEARLGDEVAQPKVVRPAFLRGEAFIPGLVFLPERLERVGGKS